MSLARIHALVLSFPLTNQYDSSTTNLYSDFKFNLLSYNKLNYVIKESSNNVKVYHQNIRGVSRKLSQLSKILYSELPHIICITDHHLKDFEMDMMSKNIINLVVDNCIKMAVYVYFYMNP